MRVRSEDGFVRMYEAVDVMDLDSWQLAGVCPRPKPYCICAS